MRGFKLLIEQVTVSVRDAFSAYQIILCEKGLVSLWIDGLYRRFEGGLSVVCYFPRLSCRHY